MTTLLKKALTEDLTYFRGQQKNIHNQLKIARLARAIRYLLERETR